MKFINKKELPKAILDKHIEAFIMYITFLLTMAIYPARKTYIALLIVKKIQIATKYLDFLDIFLKEKALVLSTATNLN